MINYGKAPIQAHQALGHDCTRVPGSIDVRLLQKRERSIIGPIRR